MRQPRAMAPPPRHHLQHSNPVLVELDPELLYLHLHASLPQRPKGKPIQWGRRAHILTYSHNEGTTTRVHSDLLLGSIRILSRGFAISRSHARSLASAPAFGMCEVSSSQAWGSVHRNGGCSAANLPPFPGVFRGAPGAHFRRASATEVSFQ